MKDALHDDEAAYTALLPPERRLSLYMNIARRMRAIGRDGDGIRHASVRHAWDARNELRRS